MTRSERDDPEARSRAAGLTRRRLLAGLGGVGAVGMTSGVGTFAHFSDAEVFADNAFGAGEIDIDLSCDGCVAGDDGLVHFAFDDIDRGDAGHIVLSVDVQTNPARLWLGTQCPPVPDPLGDAIEATLTVRGFSRSGSLSDLRREFVEGLRLDDRDGDACLDPTSGPLEIVLDWTLPATTLDSVAGSKTSFDVQLYAEQCRHVSEDAAVGSNPFAAFGPCDQPPACVVCEGDNGTKIGSLTFEYLGSSSTNVVVVAHGGAGTKSGKVVFDERVDSGQSFVIDSSTVDGDRLARNLYVDELSEDEADDEHDESDTKHSGKKEKKEKTTKNGVKIHTSCSEPLTPGMVFGNFEIVSGTTVDGEQLCDDAVNDPEKSDEPEPPEEPDDPDQSDCGVCDDGTGRLRDLTFTYLGDADATIEISTKQTGSGSGPIVFGPKTVRSGELLSTDGSDVPQNWDSQTDGLGPNTLLEIVDGGDPSATTSVTLHTSCSERVAVGDTLGSDDSGGPLYEIVAGNTVQDGPLCGSEDL